MSALLYWPSLAVVDEVQLALRLLTPFCQESFANASAATWPALITHVPVVGSAVDFPPTQQLTRLNPVQHEQGIENADR
jgi:hypothetical protein